MRESAVRLVLVGHVTKDGVREFFNNISYQLMLMALPVQVVSRLPAHFTEAKRGMQVLDVIFAFHLCRPISDVTSWQVILRTGGQAVVSKWHMSKARVNLSLVCNGVNENKKLFTVKL